MNESEKQKSELQSQSQVPPGFRFHPTDEELLDYYLRKKVGCEKFELDVIKDVDLNKLEPWDLKEKCNIGPAVHQTDWYFFSHKDKKYPTGTRTNRATAAGFWKATGRDKSVFSNAKCIGLRKTLVFYRGRAPHGQKSDWIMHEYRLDDTGGGEFNPAVSSDEGWVVCRVFKKRNMLLKTGRDSNGNNNRNGATSEIEDDYGEADYSSYSRKILSATECPSSSNCKQEVEEADSSFHHLPPLQSPNEIGSDPSYYTPLSGLFQSGGIDILTMHEQEHSCIKSAGGDEVQAYCCSYSNTRIADLVEGGGMDWSRFETVRHNNYPSPLVSDTHQAAASTSSSRQQQPALEFPSAYDVELWNFCR